MFMQYLCSLFISHAGCSEDLIIKDVLFQYNRIKLDYDVLYVSESYILENIQLTDIIITHLDAEQEEGEALQYFFHI